MPQPDEGRYFVFGWDNLSQTALRYSAVEQLFDPAALCRGVTTYLTRYAMRPQLEMLVKLGHEDLIWSILEHDRVGGQRYDWKARSLHQFFRLTKQEYRAWRSAGGDLGQLELYQAIPEGMDVARFMEIPAVQAVNGTSLKKLAGRRSDMASGSRIYCTTSKISAGQTGGWIIWTSAPSWGWTSGRRMC